MIVYQWANFNPQGIVGNETRWFSAGESYQETTVAPAVGSIDVNWIGFFGGGSGVLTESRLAPAP
jgi:hypothetical protein